MIGKSNFILTRWTIFYLITKLTCDVFRDLMENHMKHFHFGDKRYVDRKSDYDVMEFMCRVCNWREDSLEEVKEHAKTHTTKLYTSSYRERELNRFRSDQDRSRSIQDRSMSDQDRSRSDPDRSRSNQDRSRSDRYRSRSPRRENTR